MSSSSVPPSGRAYALYWQAILGADPGPLTPAEATLFERLRDEFAATPGTSGQSTTAETGIASTDRRRASARLVTIAVGGTIGEARFEEVVAQ